jgi:hypothetical protein
VKGGVDDQTGRHGEEGKKGRRRRGKKRWIKTLEVSDGSKQRKRRIKRTDDDDNENSNADGDEKPHLHVLPAKRESRGSSQFESLSSIREDGENVPPLREEEGKVSTAFKRATKENSRNAPSSS